MTRHRLRTVTWPSVMRSKNVGFVIARRPSVLRAMPQQRTPPSTSHGCTGSSRISRRGWRAPITASGSNTYRIISTSMCSVSTGDARPWQPFNRSSDSPATTNRLHTTCCGQTNQEQKSTDRQRRGTETLQREESKPRLFWQLRQESFLTLRCARRYCGSPAACGGHRSGWSEDWSARPGTARPPWERPGPASR